MWICGAGARLPYLQETGILEEIALKNMSRNPDRNWSIWDSILYETAHFEPNLTLLLNCACCQAKMDGEKLAEVTGFQLTTYTWHTVRAPLFADCSGDSILAPLTGAEVRSGREAKSEFGEEFGLEQADSYTMGMSLLLQCRETDHKVTFTPPPWAYTFRSDEELHNQPHTMLRDLNTNFYWIELGGLQDSIHDTETVRDELLKVAFGCWDHMKNQGDHGADNWELEWLGFLPGKRESLRYVGDYILTQHDVESAAAFEDEVAYGAWQIDNHLPGGFALDAKSGGHLQKRRLTRPYGIPFRSLYSRNVPNLMFAGRNISATHIGFSTTRVMGTCGILGQAIGTAAAVAKKHGALPREVAANHIREVQDFLLEDDCYLPHVTRTVSDLNRDAGLDADGCPELLRDGIDRCIDGVDHGYYGKLHLPITYPFPEPRAIREVRLVLDSDLDREFCTGNPNLMKIPMPLFRAISYEHTSFGFPTCMLKSFTVEVQAPDGTWRELANMDGNIQRLVRIPVEAEVCAVRLTPQETWGSSQLYHTYGSGRVHIFSFEVR